MKIFLVASLCLLACAAAKPADFWILVPNTADRVVDSLTDEFDVRGHFLGTVVIAGNERTLDALKGHVDTSAVKLIPRPSSSQLVVFERESLEGDSAQTVAAWGEAVIRVLENANIPSKQIGRRHIFAICPLPLESSVFTLEIPDGTEVMPVAYHALRRVSQSNKERLLTKLKKFRHRADIQDYVDQVNATTLREFVEYLTGEDPSSPLTTRNSFSDEALTAAQWIQSLFRSYGFSVSLEDFDNEYGPNVIAILPGSIEPEKYVVLGAHYDSRSTDRNSPTMRAPGANDDGSGTGILLHAAKIISENNIRFRYSVVIGAWCGEEQGLVGSRAYALKCRQNGMDIVGMFQGDMLAYRRSGEEAQCAFPDRYDDKELTALAMTTVNTYVPAVKTCYTTACCSDHQSFTEQGYSATQFFERCGSIADDQYHKSGDLVNRSGYDFEQYTYNAQALIANLLNLAEPL